MCKDANTAQQTRYWRRVVYRAENTRPRRDEISPPRAATDTTGTPSSTIRYGKAATRVPSLWRGG